MKLILRKLHGWLTNWYYPYTSRCRNCGRNWHVCEAHYTPYTIIGIGGSSCFVFCEDCFLELEPEAMLPYYKDLIDKWISYGDTDKDGQSWEDLWNMVEGNVRNKV